jgi:tetratricopeptide (TPR) repeat protein
MNTPVAWRLDLRVGATFALAVLFSALGLCAPQDRVMDALRKGIVEEETNRDLNAAIRSYQSALAHYGEDRKSAATALFRIAECYRKLGKSKEAIAAYSRVVRDFGDQTRLADESRNLLSRTYKVLQQAAGPVDPAVDARHRYRALLEEEIQVFHNYVDFIQKQYELGMTSTVYLNHVRGDLARVESRLAAFDAGMIPQVPAGVRTQAALAVRAQYRMLLQTAVDYAVKDLEAAQEKYNLGMVSTQQVIDARMRVIEAKLGLAAFDAGLAQPQGAAGAVSARQAPPIHYTSVRLACAAISSEANSRRASLGNAAAAIIAALSVERPGEGK